MEKYRSSVVVDSPAISEDAVSVWRNIERLGLTRYIAELEVLGYTIIPPEKISSPEFIDRAIEKIFDVVERRAGVRPDIQSGRQPTSVQIQKDGSEYIRNSSINSYLLFEDPVFQKIALNEAVLAIVDCILGKSANITASLSLIKGPGGQDLPLHVDNVITPAPFGRHEQFCNATWCLTDYSRENGALCFVPGSHKYSRPPNPGEGVEDRVPIHAPAGSVVIWPGSTWHGAFAKETPGLRVTMITQYIRPHIRPLEPYRENVTAELLASNPPRFGTLVGQDLNHGWKEEGPQNDAEAYKRGRHAYD